MTSVPLILVAAAGVGIAHSVLPDHWVPLAVVARANRWNLTRTARMSFLASLGHVAVSLVLGVLLSLAGLALRRDIVNVEGQIVGGVLVLTGVGFLIWALLTRGREHDHSHEHEDGSTHHHHEDEEGPQEGDGAWVSQVAVPFGVAASPDLTILPVFFAASAIGVSAAIGALLTFAIATIGMFVALTLAATIGGYQVEWPWLEKNGHVVSALVLLVVGILVFLRF